jgi:hypothetical protein
LVALERADFITPNYVNGTMLFIGFTGIPSLLHATEGGNAFYTDAVTVTNSRNQTFDRSCKMLTQGFVYHGMSGGVVIKNGRYAGTIISLYEDAAESVFTPADAVPDISPDSVIVPRRIAREHPRCLFVNQPGSYER